MYDGIGIQRHLHGEGDIKCVSFKSLGGSFQKLLHILIICSPPVVIMSKRRLGTNEARRRTSGEISHPRSTCRSHTKPDILGSEERRLRTRNIRNICSLFIYSSDFRRWKQLFLCALYSRRRDIWQPSSQVSLSLQPQK